MTWNAAAQEHLRARQGYAPRWLLWVNARNRSDGTDAPMGVWQGDDHQTISADGQARLYYGAQGAMMPGAIRYRTGTLVQSQDVTISGLTPAGQTLLRTHDVRFRPAELHLALLDPQTGDIIDVKRMFRGSVDRVSMPTAAMGETASVTLSLVSGMRRMTQTLAIKKSDESQKRRSGDRFRRYGAVAGTVTVPWGSEREGGK